MPTYTLPYTDPFGTGSKRPYVVLRVTGPSGANGAIVGVVDSGADSTCLPFSYASLMGYRAGDLERREGVGAGGVMDTWAARTPATAVVDGLAEPSFAIRPLFLPNISHALWGRADFFREFGIAFDELGQAFKLTTVARGKRVPSAQPRPAPHIRHVDGSRGRAGYHDPGVARPRRPQDHAAVHALRTRRRRS